MEINWRNRRLYNVSNLANKLDSQLGSAVQGTENLCICIVYIKKLWSALVQINPWKCRSAYK